MNIFTNLSQNFIFISSLYDFYKEKKTIVQSSGLSEPFVQISAVVINLMFLSRDQR